MINSVSGVSFRGEALNTQDLINAPGKYAAPADVAVDSFEKQGKAKKKGGRGLLATAAVALAAFVALGIAVKKGHLERVEINEANGFFKKLLQKGQNLATTVGEYAVKAWDATGGRFRESITSDALEALIGAIYLDGGFANAKEFILKYILNDLEGKRLFYDSKTILQEMVQGGQEKGIVYQLVGEEGPDHNKSFRVEVVIGGEAFGCGIGRTKKAAEQEAAYQAILKLKEGKVQ